jgi:hypothetical protein
LSTLDRLVGSLQPNEVQLERTGIQLLALKWVCALEPSDRLFLRVILDLIAAMVARTKTKDNHEGAGVGVFLRCVGNGRLRMFGFSRRGISRSTSMRT